MKMQYIPKKKIEKYVLGNFQIGEKYPVIKPTSTHYGSTAPFLYKAGEICV